MLDAPQSSEGAETQAEELPVDRLAAELGPFDPPADFLHGEEFIPAPPRPIPARLRQGSYARRRRSAIITLLVLAFGCFVFAPLPFVREIGFYVLAFQYLHWIGLGLLVIAVGILLQQRFDAGQFRYVRDGNPFVGRVLGVDLATVGTAEAPHFRYAVALEYVHPETGRRETGVVFSESLALAAQAERFEPGVEAGDYVTLVGFPGRIEKTVQVYGMLGLDPDREFILKDGEPRRGMSTKIVVLLVCGWLGFLLLVTAGLNSIWFYFPIDGDWTIAVVPAILGAIAGGVAAGVLVRRDSVRPGWFDRWATYAGGAGVGVLGAMIALSMLNAVFDDSPAEYRPIEVVEYWQITHYPVFIRNYEIEFRELGDKEPQKQPARISEMERFHESNLGVMEIGRGAFELEWVRHLHPLSWVPAEAAPKGVAPFLVNAEEGGVAAIAPVIELDDGTLIPPPEPLVDRARDQIRPFLAEQPE